MKRLNGWQRIGIVLSVVWAIGALAYIWQDAGGRISNNQKSYFTCIFAPNSDGTLCEAREKVFHSETTRIAVSQVSWALATIPIAWLIAYGVIGLVRWIRRGFSPKG